MKLTLEKLVEQSELSVIEPQVIALAECIENKIKQRFEAEESQISLVDLTLRMQLHELLGRVTSIVAALDSYSRFVGTPKFDRFLEMKRLTEETYLPEKVIKPYNSLVADIQEAISSAEAQIPEPITLLDLGTQIHRVIDLTIKSLVGFQLTRQISFENTLTNLQLVELEAELLIKPLLLTIIGLLRNAMYKSVESQNIKVVMGIEAGQLVISIVDDGKGIQKRHLQPGVSDNGSTGMGISMAASLVAEMQGHMHIASSQLDWVSLNCENCAEANPIKTDLLRPEVGTVIRILIPIATPES